MSKETYICDPKECPEPCIQNHHCRPDGCKDKLWCMFKKTDEYQITEIPEPVWVLDIQYPVDERYIEAACLLKKAKMNMHPVKCKEYDSKHDGILYKWIMLNDGGHVTVPKSWLKQKQPEPTREELQEKIDGIMDILDMAKGCNQETFDAIFKVAYPDAP